MLLRAGKEIVSECCVWANEDAVSKPDTIPQLHTTFDGDAVAYDDVVFDEDTVTNVAVLANACAGQDMGESPDPGPFPDLARFAESLRMNKNVAHDEKVSGLVAVEFFVVAEL